MCEVYATNKWVSPAASTDTEAEEARPSTSTPSGSVPSGSVPSGSVPYVEQLLTMKVYKYVLLYHPCRMSVSKTPMVQMCIYVCL